VIGAGHAGCEAAYAAARLGVRVGLCTLSADTVAHMPCNPAIGGTAKGHLVREIDALGGLMARAIDATGIQFKLLNRSRGPAVWSPRAQADKIAYRRWVKAALDRESIDFERCVADGRFRVERGDTPPVPFSFLSSSIEREQIACHLLHTGDRVRDLVCANIDRSPLFNGQIRGIGPRYCPSLEDKIVRFPDKERHQIFLEPEGLDAREIYVNGFSMSLPRDVQADLVHAPPGLEDAALLRPGYAG